MIKLYVEPRQTCTWREFKSQNPPYSIALDGRVSGVTQRDPSGPYANFDHHNYGDRNKVDRVITRATCAQVYTEIKLGLYQTFQIGGIPTASVYVNDCDEDVCLSVWLLKNHERLDEPLIKDLVIIEDRLDTTAGAFPLPENLISRQMEWIFEPYRIARYHNQLSGMGDAEMKSLIENVCSRISQYANNEAQERGLLGQYEIVGGKSGQNGWALIRETGSSARRAMYASGINAFVSYLGVSPEGMHKYSIGRRSVWITHFPLENLYNVLNQAEAERGNEITNDNCWGGSDIIGGSPRKTGSALDPQALEKIVNSLPG